MLEFLFSRYKAYRKRKGGIWYRKRIIHNMGTSITFYWTQTDTKFLYTTETEDYTETIHERRKRIIKKIIMK